MLGGMNGEEATIRGRIIIASKRGQGHCLTALFACIVCIVCRLFERPLVRYPEHLPFGFVLVSFVLSSDLD